MSSIKRQAMKDADEYARAKMFYGEGAGVRRRLINQTVNFKIANVPGYDLAFQKELSKQDFAKLSRHARRERRTIDAKDAVVKNGRALVRGDYRAMSLPILAVGATIYIAHQTGYDKKAIEASKRQYEKARMWVIVKRDQRKNRKDKRSGGEAGTGPTGL